ncbi:hypothetical protein D3C86_1844270 [compost metagenome]
MVGSFMKYMQPIVPIIRNQIIITGPKKRPMNLVPNCWITKIPMIMAMAMGTVLISGLM